MKPKFIMMVGLPGSGKSYYSNIYKNSFNAVVHASDDIRAELFGSVQNQQQNDKVFSTLHSRVVSDLKDGKNVIYDATNINYKRRKSFLDRNLHNIDCEKICVFVATPYEKCLENNQNRVAVVPQFVIDKMYKTFYVPQYYEGWDKITIEYGGFGGYRSWYSIYEIFGDKDGLNSISQDNPHHTLTIGEHCSKCAEEVEKLKEHDPVLSLAALFHDIGKKFTKSFKNSKNEITDVAHYYQHENVSAYMSVFFASDYTSTDFTLAVAKYIQFHMRLFDNNNEKLIDLLGIDAYNDLLLLHEADLATK